MEGTVIRRGAHPVPNYASPMAARAATWASVYSTPSLPVRAPAHHTGKRKHAHVPVRRKSVGYGYDDGVFGLDDAFEVIVTGTLMLVAVGVAATIGPRPFTDPFGIRSAKKRSQ